MAASVFLVALAIAALVVLLVGEKTQRHSLRIPAKLLASASFVAVGALRLEAGDTSGAWLVLALALCALGDAALLHRKGFVAGLGLFLLGHLAYLGAFQALAPVRGWPVGRLVPVVLVSGVAANRLWPHLGRLRWAVLAYVTVISLMVWGAASMATIGDEHGYLRLAGAILFYSSDLFVARDRFVDRAFVNRALGLPLYYAGQLMLAFTVGGGHVAGV